MHDSDYSTTPYELSASNLSFYNFLQKEKDKALVQLHNDFTLAPRVLFHTALDAFGTPNAEFFVEQLLQECQQFTEDLCAMLLEYFGKHIIQPGRDLFKKATCLVVSQSSSIGFLMRSRPMWRCRQQGK